MKLSTSILSIAGLLATHAAPAVAGKYEQAVSFATFSSTGCNGGQTDYLVSDGVCRGLPGKGLKLWWKQPGCEIRVFTGNNCDGDAANLGIIDRCWDVSFRYSYQVYC
ncbi:hypothetical protein COCVIDRAFT_24167 [Bipolaris victoriae FI3]|uniref:Uncharacterized protein n=2 Tax=Bipolaris TaxID=33194 RepID=W6YGV5_COCC2|nr:uncharacterized protein COCCADRAFT_3882 [Bipolaris zeicola 26-R-13]XP_014559446.1 hypothetical protein COCVIDRAFT_24167 [Bipolaris victoriae FI3]EUC34789.1 hypothetical protein COCCADRAFT_3882 [Bipolaris zeicola 26-R-13]